MRTLLHRCLSLSAILIFGLSARIHAQAPGPAATTLPRDSVKVGILRQILKETHAVDLAISAMETSLPAQRAANPRVPAVFWERFMARVHDRAGDLENALITIYDKHFSTDELRQLLAFYQTPVGRKFLGEQPAIMRESLLAGQDWGQRIGAEVAQQLAAEGIKIQP